MHKNCSVTAMLALMNNEAATKQENSAPHVRDQHSIQSQKCLAHTNCSGSATQKKHKNSMVSKHHIC